MNEEVTPEDLAEALKPMGTEAQNLPKPYALRMREEGRQEGRQEGQQEGRRESQLEIARRLLAEGMSPAKVAALTDLPLEEVQTLSH
jgi:predicted transposase/invertase (TIGR01784 family)